MSDSNETRPDATVFDFSAFPEDTLFYDRRSGLEGRDRRAPGAEARPAASGAAPRATPERRVRKERRKRIDPTTFEKQYTDDELEFMTAMQRFKVQSGKAFPSHGEVLKIAVALGYRLAVPEPEFDLDSDAFGIDEEESPSREIEPALPV